MEPPPIATFLLAEKGRAKDCLDGVLRMLELEIGIGDSDNMTFESVTKLLRLLNVRTSVRPSFSTAVATQCLRKLCTYVCT